MADAKISIASDTRAAAAGIKSGVIEPLEDAQEALERVGREADDAGEQLEDSFRDAQRRSRELGDEYEQTARTIASGSKQAAYKINDVEKAAKDAKNKLDDIDDVDMKRLRDEADRAEGKLEDVGDEGRQVATELGSSFDGSADSAADAFQDIATNALATFGPAGVIAGVGTGIAIGAIRSFFEDAEERSEEWKNKVAEDAREWTQAFVEAGSTNLSFAQEMARLQDVITDTESWEEAQALAEATGIDIGTAVAAIAGDTDALAEAQQGLNDAFDETGVSVDTWVPDPANTELNELITQLGEAQEIINGTNESIDQGTAAYDAGVAALERYAQANATTTEQVDELGSTLYTLPDETQVLITADGNALTDPEMIAERLADLDGQTATTTTYHNDPGEPKRNEIERKLDQMARPRSTTMDVRARLDDRAVRSWQPAPKSMAVIPYVKGSVRAP